MNANEAFKGRGGQTRLAEESDLSRQVINSILKDSRERLNQVPDEKTIVGLAKAFRIEPEIIWSAVAVSLGLPSYVVPSITHEVRTAHNAVLLGELGKRLGLEVTIRAAEPPKPTKAGQGEKTKRVNRPRVRTIKPKVPEE